ncbi:MAG: helix-turn-helix domain-containing protein [Burkholderiaceae bacterium]|nr:helix-turn-helix domain-containing protein [Burkholderiaceae bacterium]
MARMLSVLDLFGQCRPTLTVEDIAEALSISRPTSYRYVRILLDANLLQPAGNATYALGPKIITLDHWIRAADPVLQSARPLIKRLASTTGFDCIISGWFGNQVLDTHREHGVMSVDLPLYDRGRPRPLFAGSAPKLILASLPNAQLRKVFDNHRQQALAAGLPGEWPAFRKYYAAIRRAGRYLSNGEGHLQYVSVGAPIVNPADGLWSTLTVVFDKSQLQIVDTGKLTDLTIETAKSINALIDRNAAERRLF